MQLISQISQKIKTFGYLFSLSDADKKFIKFSKKQWRKNKYDDTDGELLVDQMFYDLYIFQLSYITNFFLEKYNIAPKHFHFISREKIFLRIFFQFFRRFSRVDKLYTSFNCKFSLGQKYYKKSIQIAEELEFKSKEELLNFTYEGVKLGDLVYDTYLRMYLEPTVDLADKRLKNVLINALDIYFTSKEYLNNNDVKKIVLSHAVYIQYAILGRIGLSLGIDVYIFSWERVVHKLTSDHLVPTPRHLEYKEIFEKKSNKSDHKNQSRKILNDRLNGQIDRGIAYMKTSPYADTSDPNQKIFLNNGKPKVALMMHCFYDAPHIYKNMIFEDFFEWIEFVFSRVEKMDVDFVVKPHPNAQPLNNEIIENFKKKYPNIRFLDKNTSNKKIIAEGIDLLLTVYGTVGHEFAYHDVKVLMAGDNPTAAYNFSLLPSSKDQYEYYLMNIDQIELEINKKDIEEFFYMHYLNIGEGRIEGNNDLFFVRKRDYDPSNKDMFIELIDDASSKKFDCIFDSFSKAIEQVDSRTTD
ncbi:MAG: hypothetical protein P8L74_01085 [Gammaproteobacteria bacterium]|nr:hypothetical protein [Gammaproteobacteria bacterium]